VRKDWIGLGYQWTFCLNAVSGTVLKAVDHSPETGITKEEVRSRGEDGTVASVVNQVAKDIKREMDYRLEASNSYKFRDMADFVTKVMYCCKIGIPYHRRVANVLSPAPLQDQQSTIDQHLCRTNRSCCGLTFPHTQGRRSTSPAGPTGLVTRTCI